MLNQRQEPKPRVTPELDESNDDVVSSASQKPITSTTTKRAKQSWVRTAAQAALSIHVHAILESTGHSTASVKLQHASLPYIASSKGRHDDDCEFQSHLPSSGNRIANLVNEFESLEARWQPASVQMQTKTQGKLIKYWKKKLDDASKM
jgi:hypothetical protein